MGSRTVRWETQTVMNEMLSSVIVVNQNNRMSMPVLTDLRDCDIMGRGLGADENTANVTLGTLRSMLCFLSLKVTLGTLRSMLCFRSLKGKTLHHKLKANLIVTIKGAQPLTQATIPSAIDWNSLPETMRREQRSIPLQDGQQHDVMWTDEQR
ncbi:hypothetical protein EYF80_003640 [Liparis tanakae]|uniref:Uncharacterized protein n=1 Tax=Liparis tanakae TaxID=230148 RepID=A0A4Z2J973_9TELE|nr:hypothetical protein EYF80_003640 [Liparis tanakae]